MEKQLSNTLSIDLLAPRYEVIDDFPFNDRFEVGDVLEFFAAKDRDKKEYWYHHDQTHQNFQDFWFDTYPHLFRKLQWWEKRKVEEMPEYVRYFDGSVLKASVWKLNQRPDMYFVCEDPQCGISARNCTPATEQDYTEYLKSKP